jgi:aminoglycoside phosphotransferase family enzyme
MLDLAENDPQTLADLLNDVYADEKKDELATIQPRLRPTFAYVKAAVDSEREDGRVTSDDKFRAIKELRGEFSLSLQYAKDAVEGMMGRYRNNKEYVPTFVLNNNHQHQDGYSFI